MLRSATHTEDAEYTFGSHRATRRPVSHYVLALGSLFAAALAAIPLVYLLVRVSAANPTVVSVLVARGRTLELLFNTVGLVVSVAAASLVIGVTIAWLVTRSDLAGRRAWLVISSLPLAIPSYVAAFGWVATTPLRGFWGAWLVLTVCNIPLVTLPTVAALRQSNSGAEDVARTLGKSRIAAFMAATWPQVRPAALAGTLLVSLYVLSDFGAVALMRFDAFTWAIHTAYSSLFDRTLAATLSVLLAVLGIALVYAERRARGAHTRFGSTVTTRTPVVPTPLGRGAILAHTGLASIAVLSLGVPLATLVRYLGLRVEGAIAVTAADLAADLGATVMLAGAGAAIALTLSFPIGLFAARVGGALARLAESVSYLGLALPGIVVGLALVFFSLAVVPALYQTGLMLAFAYGILFLPKALGAVRSSIEQVEPGLEDVGRTLGETQWGVWRRVTARIAWPGIGAGALLVALTAMKELPATLLLRPTGTDTLATSLWRLTEASAYSAAAPYAVLLIVAATIPTLLLTREAMAHTAPRKGARL